MKEPFVSILIRKNALILELSDLDILKEVCSLSMDGLIKESKAWAHLSTALRQEEIF